MNKEDFQVEVDTHVEFESEFQMDKYRFLKLKMYLGHTGLNSNMFYISEEVFTKALPTLSNIPIVAKINPISNDFENHNHYEDEEGRIIRDTDVMGVIPETHNPRFEIRNDLASDGVARKYLVVDGLLWTRNIDLMEAVISKDGIIKNSLEMKLDSTLDEESQIKIVNSIVFEALCFLGDNIGEGMKGSKSFLTNFSQDEGISESTIQKALKLLEKGAIKMEEPTNFDENPVVSDEGNGEDAVVDNETVVDEGKNETGNPVDNPEGEEKDSNSGIEEEPESPVEKPETNEEEKETEEQEKEPETEVPPVEIPPKEPEVTEPEEPEEKPEEPTEKPEKPEEELIPVSTYTELKGKKKKLEDKYNQVVELFDAQKSELEKLRAYRTERESEDLRAEFSATLPTAKVTEVIEAKKSEGLDAIRTALFAEVGKTLLENSTGVATFSAKKQDTFMVKSHENQGKENYGKFGEM